MPFDRPSPRALWASQPSEGFTMSLDEIHAKADRLHRTVRRRNLTEYLAAIVVIAAFGWYIVLLPGWAFKAGSALVILGTLYVVWQLSRRGTAAPVPLDGSLAELIAFHRSELERQRDALRSVLRWYLAPLMPGLALFILGFALQAPLGKAAVPLALVMASVAAAVFVGVWRLNVWGAARLQKMIDALATK